MKRHHSNALRVGLLALMAAACPIPQALAASYSVVETIRGPDGDFDYLSVDSDRQRPNLARDYGMMAVDLASDKVTPKLLDTASWLMAALLIPGTDLLLTTSEESNGAILLHRATGEIEARIPTGKGPDGALFDPGSKLVYVMNGDSGDVAVIDTTAKRVVATVPVGGKPEAAASNGRDKVFVNIEDRNDVAVIDSARHQLLARYALPGCEEPTGLAYDPESGLLISACHNGTAKLIYLPAFDTRKDANGKDEEVPGTFRILVVAPK